MRPTYACFLVLVALAGSLSACSASGSLTAAPAASPSPKPTGATASQLTPADPAQVCALYFGIYDANHDGSVTLAEYSAAKLVPGALIPPGTQTSTTTTSPDGTTTSATVIPPSQALLDSSFKAIDTNGDGKLTQAELCVAVGVGKPTPAPTATPQGKVAVAQ